MNTKSCVIASLCLAMSLTALSQAETLSFEPEAQVSWRDVDTSLYEGEWVSTGLGYEAWLPVQWKAAELTRQEQEDGVILRYVEEESGRNLTVAFGDFQDEIPTVESIYEELSGSEDYSRLSYLLVNSIPAVGFDEKDGVSGISFVDSSGNMVLFAVAPTAQEEDLSVAMNILVSIRPER